MDLSWIPHGSPMNPSSQKFPNSIKALRSTAYIQRINGISTDDAWILHGPLMDPLLIHFQYPKVLGYPADPQWIPYGFHMDPIRKIMDPKAASV